MTYIHAVETVVRQTPDTRAPSRQNKDVRSCRVQDCRASTPIHECARPPTKASATACGATAAYLFDHEAVEEEVVQEEVHVVAVPLEAAPVHHSLVARLLDLVVATMLVVVVRGEVGEGRKGDKRKGVTSPPTCALAWSQEDFPGCNPRLKLNHRTSLRQHNEPHGRSSSHKQDEYLYRKRRLQHEKLRPPPPGARNENESPAATRTTNSSNTTRAPKTAHNVPYVRVRT